MNPAKDANEDQSRNNLPEGKQKKITKFSLYKEICRNSILQYVVIKVKNVPKRT